MKWLSCERLTYDRTPVQWERVAQAADCAKMVHAADQPVNCIISTLTSRDGGTRGFGLYEYKPNAGERTIVVAFRATRNIMDWMANSNVAAMTYEELGSGAVVHSGLGSIARKTQHLLSKELDKAMSNSSLKYNTLFTGHSGGGAIAQLLFAFMNSESSALSFLREGMAIALKMGFSLFNVYHTDGRISSIHCITFGSPPISNPSISSPSQSEFWCFCNEGDPVPLLEPDYAGILLKAWAEPLPSDTENREWRTPTPIFLPSGSQVAIRSEIDDGPRGPARRTSSFLLDLEARSCVLFGNPLSHSMANSYIPRIRELQLRASENLNPFDDPPHETGPNA